MFLPRQQRGLPLHAAGGKRPSPSPLSPLPPLLYPPSLSSAAAFSCKNSSVASVVKLGKNKSPSLCRIHPHRHRRPTSLNCTGLKGPKSAKRTSLRYVHSFVPPQFGDCAHPSRRPFFVSAVPSVIKPRLTDPCSGCPIICYQFVLTFLDNCRGSHSLLSMHENGLTLLLIVAELLFVK